MNFWAQQKRKHGAFKLAEMLTKISDLNGLLWSSGGKESACNVEDLGSVPGLGGSPGGGHGNPLQYSCPENQKDRGAWRPTVHGIGALDTTDWLSTAQIWMQAENSEANYKSWFRDRAAWKPKKQLDLSHCKNVGDIFFFNFWRTWLIALFLFIFFIHASFPVIPSLLATARNDR